MIRKKILIAADSEINRAILANMLSRDFDIMEAADGRETIETLRNYRHELSALLLDVVMPEMDGFEVLEEMKRREWTDDLPVIMISVETGNSFIDHAFSLGASDYISRPFVPSIIKHRIINTILLHGKKQQLMEVVTNRFYRREKSDKVLVSILGYAVEFRCGMNGTHMSNVSHITALLLNRLIQKTDKYTLSESDIDTICIASGLHDIGKLLIPEEILNNADKLTKDELEIYKHHTQIGAQIISGLPIYQNERLVKYAASICHWHHERFDGKGYPDGLKGDDIPIAAQVVSLADTYDNLVNGRVYKKSPSREEAISMLIKGDCGSFNPIILSCLDDISDELKKDPLKSAGAQIRKTVHKAVDELYGEQDLISARITQQLEDASTKQEFMTNMCDEVWFEYTAEPSSLHLSKGAIDATDLPSVIVDPLENEDFLAVAGRKTTEMIKNGLKALHEDESSMELTADIILNGKLCRCKLAILVLRSAGDSRHLNTLLGKITDIDESYYRLESYDKVSRKEVSQQTLIPVTADKDDVISITHDQVGLVMQSYRKMFETVRLVDPGICMQLSAGVHGISLEKSDHCYSVWNKNRRCERCISQDAIKMRKTQSKVEAVDNNVYYVLAMCIEIDGIPYSLECVNPIRSDERNGLEEESILNQLLVRNRQVYTDSLTKVFNRRYYDDRLENISGEYAVAMIDIDNFKDINDRFGHAAGDKALYRTAMSICSVLRSNDELIRYGGDEFFLLLHGLPEQSLSRKLKDICTAVENTDIAEYPGLKLSASIGGVCSTGRIGDMLKKADEALYRAKEKHNCVVIFGED